MLKSLSCTRPSRVPRMKLLQHTPIKLSHYSVCSQVYELVNETLEGIHMYKDEKIHGLKNKMMFIWLW